ncbi:hypothetical protein MPSEU_000850700 [Mayamaea pseudoterrestris]|nr:hypothetical protein MPSEU_000850700 [Mayamaea pseudoterrestris]
MTGMRIISNNSRHTTSTETFRSALDYDGEDSLCRALQSQLHIDSSDWVLPSIDESPCSFTVQEEAKRLHILKSYQVLNTDNEEAIDQFAEEVRASFDVPWACLSLVDMGRQYTKAFERQDIAFPKEISRQDSFCSRTILQDSLLIVKDLLLDDRFKDSKLVKGTGPLFRFYAGAPLVSPEGAKLGTLCLLDRDPRPQGLTAQEQETLLNQAKEMMQMLVDRRNKLSTQRKRSESPPPTSPRLEPSEKKCCEMSCDSVIPLPQLNVQLPDPVKSTLNPDEYLLALIEAMYGVKPVVKAALELVDYFDIITEEQMAAYNMDVVTACRQNDVEKLQSFVEASGRDVLDCYNRFGEGLLNMACRRGFKDIVKFLLSDKVKLSIRIRDDYGRTPMHDTCWNPEPQTEIVSWLMAVDPTLFLVADKRGFTPFQYARQNDWPVWRQFLFSNRDRLSGLFADPRVLKQFVSH